MPQTPASVAIGISALLALGLSHAQTELEPMAVETRAPSGTAFVTHLDWSGERALELSEHLAGTAGLQLRSLGGLGAYSEASLRGSAARHVAVYLDGTPLQLAGGQSINLALFPAAILGGAEVYRGQAPLALGSGAAGAINLLPRTAEGSAGGQGSAGSFSSRRAAGYAATGTGLLSLGHESTAGNFPIRNPFKPFDPADPERRASEPRQHAGLNQQFGLGRQAWGRRDLLLYGFRQRQELPDRVNSPDPGSELDTDLVLATLRQRFTTASVRAELQQHTESYRDPGSRIGLGAQDSRYRSRRAALSGSREADNWAGFLQTAWQDYRARDQLSQTNTATARRAEMVAAASAPLAWGADFGLRLNAQRERASAGREHDEFFADPRLGWARASGQRCRWLANLGQRSRAPGFFERYGDRGYVLGNADLQAEQVRFLDLGRHCAWDSGARLQWALFAQDLRDAISFVYDARGVGQAHNASRAQIRGAELESRWPLGPTTELDLNATWLDSEDRSQVRASRGRQLPGRAQWQGFARLRHEQGVWQGFYEFLFESGQFYDSANLLATPAVRQHNIGLSWKRAGLGLTLEARNLLDQRQAQFNGFPRPGRQYSISLQTQF